MPGILVKPAWITTLLLFGQAFACNELKSRSEALAVVGYQDSSWIAKNLNEGFSGVGSYLSTSNEPLKRNFEESPFKGSMVRSVL